MGWNEGYVTDLLYTYGYYTELNPLTARLLLLINGIACKSEFDTACELPEFNTWIAKNDCLKVSQILI